MGIISKDSPVDMSNRYWRTIVRKVSIIKYFDSIRHHVISDCHSVRYYGFCTIWYYLLRNVSIKNKTKGRLNYTNDISKRWYGNGIYWMWKYSWRENTLKGDTLRRIKTLKENVMYKEISRESGNTLKGYTEKTICWKIK